jgi:hypothetical protein
LNAKTKCIVSGVLGLGLLGWAAGCQPASPPANIAVPANPSMQSYRYPADYPKPLPDQNVPAEPPTPAFNDVPLVDQRLPEEAWFVSTYNQVGRPKIALFINRTLDGDLVAGRDVAVASTDTVHKSTGSVEFSQSQHSGSSGYYDRQHQGTAESFKSNGPAEYHETTTTWLHPGQYDDAQLQALDYAEMESLMTDWLHCNGQITLISPSFLRSRLNDQQVKDLQSGKPNAMTDVGQATAADVLVQIQAHPTRRDGQLAILLIAEAVNVRGGESIGHASVEMPTPVDRYKMNDFTRFLTRKLMHEMAGSWTGAPAAAPANSAPAAVPLAPLAAPSTAVPPMPIPATLP